MRWDEIVMWCWSGGSWESGVGSGGGISQGRQGS